MPRTPNTKCTICSKPLYRRPYEFKEGVEFACKGCTPELFKRRPTPKAFQKGWDLTWKVGDNHLTGTSKTEETKKKISEANKKFWKEHPEELKERGRKRSQNSNHKTSLVSLIRTSKKYKEWTKEVFVRDDYTCQHCKIRSAKGITVHLQAHHIKPFSLILDQNLLFKNDTDTIEKAFNLMELWEVKNGLTLCLECHKKVHNKNNIYVRKRKNVNS